MGQINGDGIPDLLILGSEVALELPVIRECLDPRVLAYGERPSL